MASLHKTDKSAKGGSNGGHERSGNEQGQQVIADPASDDSLSRAISEAAYYRAEARGFASGHELEDWVEAERQVATTSNPGAEEARA